MPSTSNLTPETIKSVSCPTCGATAGEPCVSKSGKRAALHATRKFNAIGIEPVEAAEETAPEPNAETGEGFCKHLVPEDTCTTCTPAETDSPTAADLQAQMDAATATAPKAEVQDDTDLDAALTEASTRKAEKQPKKVKAPRKPSAMVIFAVLVQREGGTSQEEHAAVVKQLTGKVVGMSAFRNSVAGLRGGWRKNVKGAAPIWEITKNGDTYKGTRHPEDDSLDAEMDNAAALLA